MIDAAIAAIGSGREEAVLRDALEASTRFPDEPALWQVIGLLQREMDRLEDAVRSLGRAAQLDAGNLKIAHGYAQCLFEAGLPSRDAFAKASRIAPHDSGVVLGWAAAIAHSEGPPAAIAFLRPRLQQQPRWLNGHWQLAQLLGISGSGEPIDSAIAQAVRAYPHDNSLWHHWIAILMNARRFDETLLVIREALTSFPSDPALMWTEAACLTELGATEEAEQLYLQLGPVQDASNTVYYCRHLLRTGRADVLARSAEGLMRSPAAESLYPYISLALKVCGDNRLDWLEATELVGVYDLRPDLPNLDEVAALLKQLHNQAEQPLGQSVRGGTQTDGPLLRRIEPEIRQLREVLARTVRRHIESLPPIDPRHPQLGLRRDSPVRFSGSWSVRLRSGGHHDQHVHPQGWFSSALYIALPDSLGGQAGDEGWLQLGQPQDSLGLGLPPARVIEPKPGRLVLFPSTMWHGTRPFSGGERLTVAFDVARPN